ncbi:MFS transporter [Methylocella sp.]|uniref:MFS transporter n=1 Tax=Methylocella sp. TaxID=1978226 RepID=UPI0037844342
MAIASIPTQKGAAPRSMTRDEKRLIFASGLGTVFEWYDFYLYLTLAGVMGPHFFGHLPAWKAELFILLAAVCSFLVRPVGALVFGRLGDLVGRKYTFLLTILIMGGATFLVGLLPGYAFIGTAAPTLLIVARLLQGLAIGGEYGGAAVFVAEHAPEGRRGLFTSFIQATATLGLFVSIVVVLTTRWLFGEAAFASFGWRAPFLLSAGLLGLSLFIRLSLNESPVFARMKAEGRASRRPLRDAFGNWRNLRRVLVALFGLTMGQGVVWYAGQVYALSYMQSTLRVDAFTAMVLMAWAMALASGFFVAFGVASDHIGRKPILMFGCLAFALGAAPVFAQIAETANPALAHAHRAVAVTVVADPAGCGELLSLADAKRPTTSCDVARELLSSHSVEFRRVAGPPGVPAVVRIAARQPDAKEKPVEIAAFDAAAVEDPPAARAALLDKIFAALEAAGYPPLDAQTAVRVAHPFDVLRAQPAEIIGLLFLLVLFVAMVYGPLAAALVEMFPARVRYTSVSLPYHIGNGWFGGVTPAVAFAIMAHTGNLLSGLWYPIAVAATTFVIGVFLLPDSRAPDSKDAGVEAA